MFKMYELREIIKLIDQSSIHEFELEHEGSKVTLKKAHGQVISTIDASVQQLASTVQSSVTKGLEEEKLVENKLASAPIQQAEQKTEDTNLHQIKSPMVGTFYHASSPDAESYVKIGDKVGENTVVCIVEAMKLFNEIEAEVKGEIVELLVENGQLVEYGQPLFLVRV